MVHPGNARGTRRDLIRMGLSTLGFSCAVPLLFQRVVQAEARAELEGISAAPDNRILVILELTGGNDGLNTVVPYSDDAYYRARPRLAIRPFQVLKLNDRVGLHPACTGLHALFQEGKLAIVQGCGYPNPNLSHFTAMEYWHTAIPHGSEPYGWVGRFADAHQPTPVQNYLVNIATQQSRAVTSARHAPLIFKDPDRLRRIGTQAQQQVFETFGKIHPTSNPALDHVQRVTRAAAVGAELVRTACREYHTWVDYGGDHELSLDLKKVAAMIAAGLPTRLFYLSMGGFDTHAAQPDLHQLLLIYLSDALRGFLNDLDRLGRSDDVVVMVFTEFGRRVDENGSRGTDHGTATPMFVLGKPVAGGLYGTHPSLTNLDQGNLRMTTDFRSIYATVLKAWMRLRETPMVLRGDFPQLPLFGEPPA